MVINLARRNVTSTRVKSVGAATDLTGAITHDASESVPGRTSNAVAGFAPLVAGTIALLLTKPPPGNSNTHEGEQK
jgi:hypothetical protein